MILNRRKIIRWQPPKPTILQIYSRGLEYALVSAKYEQCHPFVWCKDFLHDVMFSSLHEKWFEIYKFKFNPSVDPTPSLEKTRILLANAKDKLFAKKIPSVLDFVNQVEQKLKIKKTVAYPCFFPPKEYEKSGVFLFEGSRRWLQAPPMLSLYTLLLRVGFAHTIGDNFLETIEKIKNKEIKPYQKKDDYWLKESELGIHRILNLGDRRIFYRDIQKNYPKNITIETIHERFGIMGFAVDILFKALGQPVIVPHWHMN